MNVEEASVALGVSVSVVYEYVKNGRLAARRVPSEKNPRARRWDIDPASVDAERLRREQGDDGPQRYDVVVKLPS